MSDPKSLLWKKWLKSATDSREAIEMKKYINFAYTFIFKLLLYLMITVCAWNSGTQVIRLISRYIENPAAFLNVFTQGSSFDYESSEYAKQEVRSTVDCVLEYSLKYMKDYNLSENGDKEEYDYYMRLSNEGYKNTAEFLDSLKGVSFAVVNHDTGLIVSNIEKIDGSASGSEIRSLFGDNEDTLLIIRNCKNPYFEQCAMTGYVEYVREKAQDYNDDCDLYISFGESLSFREEPSYYEAIHNSTLDYVSSGFLKCVALTVLTLVLIILLCSVSGKAEKNGKVIPAVTDTIPNDLLLVFYIIIGTSVNALFYNSLYMLFKSATIEDYWFGITPNFYAIRANICLVAFVYIVCAFVCKIKRQKNLNTLITNTYIYRAISMFKSRKAAS